jgi:hypothetical protein
MKIRVKQKSKGEITYPADHKPAMVVPKGGSCCANCKFWDGKDCENKNYIKWNGNGDIPTDPDKFCSDWYEPK